MAKRYTTIYSSGHKEETSHWAEAFNLPVQLEDGQRWFLSGKEVTVQEFRDAAGAAGDAAYEKKNKTHKEVRVLYGNSAACYVTKWVPR